MNKILFLILFLSSCTLTSYVYDPIYEDHPHTTEVYWYTDYEIGGTPYFGYWNNFYYYYGVPHFYPWWYYYQFIPPYHHHTHTHIHVHCDNGYYVYGHRGPTLNNNIVKDFRPTIKIKNNKDKSFVFPRDWKSSNSTRTNKQSDIKYNTNKINYNRTLNYNNSNVNKTNNKPNNIRNSNKNRSNNKINRSNKKRP
tara:strand:+ start:363 stop:947 length:585 start_codon:yes stop_codon:yes gene_type:complete